MKLRNKKNGLLGELKDFINDGFIVKVPDGRGIAGYKYDSLNALNEEWEDYEPKKPLVKNEEIRDIIRAWADVNDAGRLKYNSDENSLDDIYRNTITFNRGLELEDGHFYTIFELCEGEEE